MWIMVTGACGTGKHAIVDLLKRDGFTFLDFQKPDNTKVGYDLELYYACQRLSIQLEAQKLMNRKDIITVHSFWETEEIFMHIANDVAQLNPVDNQRLNLFNDTFRGKLEPPHALVYTQSEPMTAFNRMSLRQQTVNQEEFNRQLELYKKYLDKVRVPIVDIDGNRKYEDMKKDLEFGVASLKASAVSSQTFWQREKFR